MKGSTQESHARDCRTAQGKPSIRGQEGIERDGHAARKPRLRSQESLNVAAIGSTIERHKPLCNELRCFGFHAVLIPYLYDVDELSGLAAEQPQLSLHVDGAG